MTTIEMSISGGIFVGIIVMSFQTMLAGAKLSSNTVASDQTREQVEKSQKALDKDLDASSKLVASFTGTGYTHTSTPNKISMLVPKINGKVISTTEFEVITYSLVPEVGKDGPNLLIRTETKVKSGKSDAPMEHKVAKNVKSLTVEYTKAFSITPSAGKVSLPAAISTGKPVGAQMQILGISCAPAGIQAGSSRVTINQSGVSALDLLANGLTMIGADLLPSLALPANAVVDLVSRVDPSYKPVPAEPQNLANQVTYKIVIVDTKSKGMTKERILTQSVRLPNAQ